MLTLKRSHMYNNSLHAKPKGPLRNIQVEAFVWHSDFPFVRLGVQVLPNKWLKD